MRLKVTMMLVGMNSEGEALAISLRMKLRGINIIANAEHLHRTCIPGHKQCGPFRQFITCLFMTK